MKHYLGLLYIVIFFTTCSKKDTPKPDDSGVFIKFFGGAQNDAGFSGKETSDGGFILVGSTIMEGRLDKDLYIVKTDKNGNKVWAQTFGSSYDEEGFDVKIDKDENFLIVGYVKSKNDSSDCLIVKYDKEGQFLDSFSFGRPEFNEVGNFLVIDDDGALIVAGSRGGETDSKKNMYMVKTNLDSIYWERELGAANLYDDLEGLIETPAHDLLWCGTRYDGIQKDVRITLTDTYANIYWSVVLGENDGLDQVGREVLRTNDGCYGVVGTQSDATGNTAVYLAKINSFGTLLWSKQPGGIGKTANSFYHTSDGGYIIAGTFNKDYMLLKTDSEGNVIWEKAYGGKGSDQANQVIETYDGDILVVGTVYIANNFVLGLIKTNNKGELEK